MVFTSTLTTIGFSKISGQLATEERQFFTKFTNNPYLIAKSAMEDEVLAAARMGLSAVVVVSAVFFGPYDQKATSGTQIIMIAKRQMPGYIQGPVNVIDFRDVAVAMIRAAEWGRVGECYIIRDWNTNQKELNGLIAQVSGVSGPVFPMPFPMAQLGTKVGEWALCKILHKLHAVACVLC